MKSGKGKYSMISSTEAQAVNSTANDASAPLVSSVAIRLRAFASHCDRCFPPLLAPILPSVRKNHVMQDAVQEASFKNHREKNSAKDQEEANSSLNVRLKEMYVQYLSVNICLTKCVRQIILSSIMLFFSNVARLSKAIKEVKAVIIPTLELCGAVFQYVYE